MERDIDMGQTIEEAARIERVRIILELHADYKIHGDARHYVISSTVIGKYGVNLFEAGVEWQAKQSPWISVKERLPENQDIVLVRGEYGGKATAYLHGKDSGFIVYGEDAYKVFGEVTHWMPIPDLEE
jgi:light-regulated signal transduction histidine kinase (bacteriophytochrome)|nr:MAG TPA: Protein of unknown function (DUF551) [Caudoviricetes sp.]